MTDSIIQNRRMIRQRFDPTAFHQTVELDAVTTSDKVKLDVVATKITVQPPTGMTITVDVSLDGIRWTQVVTGLTALFTYGDAVGDHLVKHVRITRTAGSSGKVIIVGA